MIKSKYIEMELGTKSANRIIKKYNLNKDLKPGDIAKIPIDKLSKHSRFKVDVTCDYCGKLLSVPFKRYNLSTKNVNKYSCSDKKCSNQKIKDVCQFKYGVDNPFQDKKVKSKIKKTLNEKYGVDHPMYLKSTKDKIKKTSIKRYGVDSYTKTKEYKIKTIKTNLERYGVEYSTQNKEVREKGKKTNLKNLGVEYSQQSSIVREKTIKTNLENWGVECNLQNEENKNKIKETNLEKYGVINPSMSEEIKDKIKKTNLERFGVEYTFQSKEIREKGKQTNLKNWGYENIAFSEDYRKKVYKISNNSDYIKYIGNNISLFNCDKGHKFEISTSNYYSRFRQNIPLCTVCNPIGDSVSLKEKELYNFIKSIYGGKIIQSYRDGMEIDIYLPKLKIGFEFNGLYWHSEEWRDKNYHLYKTNYFKNKDIKIIHIWEDDWDNKTDIIKSQINNWVGKTTKKIYARKCIIKEIKNSKIVTEFLNNNHIQGRVNSSLKLGLYYEDKLVSLMTFDHFEGRKRMLDNEWNINRFCNKLDTSVVGGASKLLKYFIKNYYPSRIISYADKNWSEGNLYKTLDFNKMYDGKPDYKYIFKNKRTHKSNFKKSKLKYNMTEREFVNKNNIWKIWDCGKIKYEYKI